MFPSVQIWNSKGNLIFQQDNHPIHCSMDIQRWFAKWTNIELILWPPRSPDLNVIEHMWAKLKKGRILRYGNNPPRNREQLWDQVVENWDDLVQDHDQCLTLIDYTPQRCQAVIDASGMWTRYQVYRLFFVCFKLFVFLCFLGKKIYFPVYTKLFIYFTLLCRANPQVLGICFSML